MYLYIVVVVVAGATTPAPTLYTPVPSYGTPSPTYGTLVPTRAPTFATAPPTQKCTGTPATKFEDLGSPQVALQRDIIIEETLHIKEKSICSEGGGPFVLDGNGNQIFIVTGSLILMDVVLQGGHATEEGGAILVFDHANLVLLRCLFRDNSADDGGAIYGIYANIAGEEVYFANNTAQRGAVNTFGSNVVLKRCFFEKNVGYGLYGRRSTIAVSASLFSDPVYVRRWSLLVAAETFFEATVLVASSQAIFLNATGPVIFRDANATILRSSDLQVALPETTRRSVWTFSELQHTSTAVIMPTILDLQSDLIVDDVDIENNALRGYYRIIAESRVILTNLTLLDVSVISRNLAALDAVVGPHFSAGIIVAIDCALDVVATSKIATLVDSHIGESTNGTLLAIDSQSSVVNTDLLIDIGGTIGNLTAGAFVALLTRVIDVRVRRRSSGILLLPPGHEGLGEDPYFFSYV